MNNNELTVCVTHKPTEPNLNEVVIYPNPDSWNDFGHKIRSVVKANFEGKIFRFDIYFAFIPNKKRNSKNRLDNLEHWLEDFLINEHLPADKKIQPNPDFDNYFSMFPDMKAYREVVSKLGKERANSLLIILNDLVARKNDKNFSRDYQIIKEHSEPFKHGFMRNSETFFALHNADSILGGLEHEVKGVLSKNLTLTFKLDSFENSHVINLNYESESILPKRINVLIGENGLGKSTALNVFAKAALQHEKFKDCLKQTGTSEDTIETRPMINRLIALATPGEAVKTFPPERKKTQKLYYRKLALSGPLKTKIGSELLNLVRVDESIASISRWNLFLETLSRFIDIDSIYIKIKPNDEITKKYIRLRSLESGRLQEQRQLERWGAVDEKADPVLKTEDGFFPLSSGQLTFFKIAVLLCRHIENGTYVLIDEPETHLHPNLISDFVELLDYLLEETGSFALMATHSPYFVREVSREQVSVFKRESGRYINITKPRLKTFGEGVDAISTFVFDDDIENSLIKKIIRKAKSRRQGFENLKQELGKELSSLSLMLIKDGLEDRNE